MSGKTTTTAAAKVSTGTGKKSPAAADVEKQVAQTADPLAARAQQYAAVNAARNKFVDASIGLGWRLALAVLVPIFIGVQIDKHYGTAPSYTVAAVLLGLGLSVVIVWKSVKEITRQENAEFDAKNTPNGSATPVKKEIKHV